ncbi:MAG TPA: LysM peptidoglycan-binding domain-containing M23 family metallopeptidase [Patescibacteria group bacterium]|nr:LysM peptidoglycan-binding domain-containing M23 family metallopeptidase [Patescibacteria group bacterium]
MNIKRLFLRGIIKTFNFLSKFGQKIWRYFSFVGKTVKVFNRFIFDFIIFPFYKFYRWFKYRLINIYAPAKSKVFYVLNKPYLIHVLIIIIGIFVVSTNINAQEARKDNYGKNTIIYSIIAKDELEVLTEETQVSQAQKSGVLSYLDESGAVESGLKKEQATVPTENLSGDLSTVTGAGSAVVKPNIIEPVSVQEMETVVEESSDRDDIINYQVKAGENVTSIATKFGISVNTILWQNGLGANSLIRPGDELEILPVTGVAHEVESGENLGSIAAEYDIDVEKIVKYNNLFDINDIQIGQNLIIPGGEKVSPYVSRSTYASSVPEVSPISKLFVPESKKTSSGSTGMIWPSSVRRITQYYSWRHTGLDIGGPTGTPIYAAESGTVIYSGWSTGYGYNVFLDHGNGVKTRYAHASRLHVSKGERVTKGQTIMSMGSTGWSTGPHLHFEVRINGVRKNPLSYIR